MDALEAFQQGTSFAYLATLDEALKSVQQMYHVKVTHAEPPGGLDLNIADEEEFSPDKLRGNIERLYMTVVRYAYLLFPKSSLIH